MSKRWNSNIVQAKGDKYLFRHVSGTIDSHKGRRRGELAEQYRCPHRWPSTKILEFGEDFSG
jgi:hypothetical protein